MDKATAAGVALGVLVAGCTAHMELSGERRQAVKAATVSALVAIPEQPVVIAKDAAAAGFLLGPFAMMAAAGASDEPMQFKNHLEENRIDVRAIVREEFLRQSAQAKRFPKVVDQGGDVVVHLAIEGYGLGPAFSFNPIDKPLSPTLAVVARMSTPKGEVLWQRQEYLTAANPDTPAHKFDAYLADGKLTEAGFRKAAEIVVAALLEEFRAAPEPAATGAPRARVIAPVHGAPDYHRMPRGHDTGGNIRFESEPGGDGRCSSYAACGARDPRAVNK